MKKYLREKCRLFEFIIRRLLEIRKESIDPNSVDNGSIKDKNQNDFFNRMFSFGTYEANYTASDISKYKNENYDFPDKFYNRLRTPYGVSKDFIDNIEVILSEELFKGKLNILEEQIKNLFIHKGVIKKGKLKEIKEMSSSKKYILNAISKSLEYIFDDTVTTYSIVSDRPSKIVGFVGREKEFDRISKCLAEKKYVVLSGMGGIGKTYLAHEYLVKYKDKYKFIKTVLFDKDIMTTIASIECSGFTEETKTKVRYEKIKELLNEYDSEAVVLIDNFYSEDYVANDEYFERMLGKFKCKFIITMRANLKSAISVGSLGDEELANLFTNQIVNRKTHLEEICQNIGTIIEALHRNTLLVELSGKVFENTNLSLRDFMKEISGEDPKYNSKKIEHGVTTKKTEDYLLALFSLAGLSDDNKQILMDFALLAEGAMIENRIVERLFKPYTSNDFDKLNRLGWIRKGYNGIEDEYTWGVHPLIASTIRRMKSFTGCTFEKELHNIECFAFLSVMDGNRHIGSSLHSIATKVKTNSEQLNLCKSRICVWLCNENRSDLAYDIYCKSEDKRSFLPHVYLLLSSYAYDDPELEQIIKEMEKIIGSEAKKMKKITSIICEKREAEYSEFIRSNHMNKINYSNFYLFILIGDSERRLREMDYKNYSIKLYLLRNDICSYRSVDAFNKIPAQVNVMGAGFKNYMDFLKEQISCSTIEETVFYKTAHSVLGESINDIRCSFVADIDILRFLLISAANAEYLYQIRMRISESTPNIEEIDALIEEYLNFLDDNSNYLNRTILTKYDIQLAYCYCDYGNLECAKEIISRYEHLDIETDPSLYFNMKNLEMYYDSISIMKQYQPRYESDTIKALFDRFDKLLLLIEEKSKKLPDSSQKIFYYTTIGIRAICIISQRFCQIVGNIDEMKEKYGINLVFFEFLIGLLDGTKKYLDETPYVVDSENKLLLNFIDCLKDAYKNYKEIVLSIFKDNNQSESHNLQLLHFFQKFL